MKHITNHSHTPYMLYMHACTRVVFIFVLDHVTNKGDKVACIPQINHNAVMNHPLLAHTKTPNLCTQWLTSRFNLQRCTLLCAGNLVRSFVGCACTEPIIHVQRVFSNSPNRKQADVHTYKVEAASDMHALLNHL